jgi:serine/threonine-protein kinase
MAGNTMDKIGPYEMRELLGAGGIGQVHAAFDTQLEREVAIKSLRPELLDDKSFVDRFHAEAKSLARLDHPNITRLYSLFSENSNLYLIMECVRGETLGDLLNKRGGRLSVRESLAIIAQVADGLGYAHSLGIVHRDIKPVNLMITAKGTVKIMDFGIARVRGSQRLTRDGGIIGTLAYMAPEQLRGEETDGRSDLYSLAIMLYEMLSGSVPFQADTDYALMQAHINTRPPRLSSRMGGLDGRIDAALTRALAKKPEQRFASVREFSDALGASLLRTDAPIIVEEGTRLIGPPPIEVPRSRFERFKERAALIGADLRLVAARCADRLTFIPANLRLPAVLSAASLAVVGLVAGASMLVSSMRPWASSAGTAATALATKNKSEIAPTARSGDLPGNIASAGPQISGAMLASVSPEKKRMFAAFDRKEYADAFKLAMALALINDRDAQDILGQTYENGLNGQKSDEQAFLWYRKAAEQGNADAQHAIGYFYLLGKGGATASDTEAVFWFRSAAEKGLAKAQKNLGDMYYQGKGVQQADKREAFEWYMRAAAENDMAAEFAVGIYYEAGRPPVNQDYQQAADWYRKAAAQGSALAQAALVRLQSKNLVKQ